MRESDRFSCLSASALGNKATYPKEYDPSLLYRIPRKFSRNEDGFLSGFQLHGFDLWNCYEVSWLDLAGKPQVRILSIIVDADSINIIESKSLKLYLNSFNNTKLSTESEFLALVKGDLEAATLSEIYLELVKPSEVCMILSGFEGTCIDDLDIKPLRMGSNALPHLEDKPSLKREKLYSDLLRSNCPVTGQPDWASVMIEYHGLGISHESLLQYIISLGHSQEFHERCVESIFLTIYRTLKPIELTVYARYTRRGGIDINPIRSTSKIDYKQISNIRHPRQ